MSSRLAPRINVAAGVVGSCLLLAVTGYLAHRKLVWTDEIFTIVISRQPTIGGLLTALGDGPDALPPLNHFLTRAAMAAFGESHIAYRLPPILLFWLTCVVNYLLLARMSRTAAWAAAIFPVGTAAFGYAFEARPYAAVMFFTALSLLAWTRAIEVRRRAWWILLLAIGIAGAIWSHWYGVLTIAAVGAGELARFGERKRIDWPVAAGVVAGALPTVFLASLAAHAVVYRGMVLPPNPVPFLESAYDLVLGRPGLLLIATLIGGLIWAWRALPSYAAVSPPVRVALVATALFPLAGYVISIATGGQLASRYVIHTLVGVSALVGCAVHMAAHTRRLVGLTIIGALGFAGLTNMYEAKLALRERPWVAEGKAEFALLGEPLRLPPPGDPIVVPDIHVYLPLWFYAPPDLRSRLLFVRKYDVMGSSSLGTADKYFAMRTVDFEAFVAEAKPFYFYEAGRQMPLFAAFIARGAVACDSGFINDGDIYPRPGYLFRMQMPGGAECR